MSPSGATVSVVIPVHRGEASLPELVRQLEAALGDIAPAFEIVLVEDGGGDPSWTVIESLARADPRVRGIRLGRNYGQHNALLCGIRAARYELIVTMDDDLQHPVCEISRLVAALGPGLDMVYGTPDTPQHGTLRAIASSLTKFALAGPMGAETARSVSAFRVFRTNLRDGFADYRSPSVSVDVLLTWTTSRFAAIQVRHAARAHGASGYTLGKLVRHALDLMTGFSTWPLQVLVNFAFRGSAVPGFAFLACLITILSGAQLFALGVFGEYLARMHFRGMNRPAYVVGEVTALLEPSE